LQSLGFLISLARRLISIPLLIYLAFGPLQWLLMLYGALTGRIRMGRLLSWNTPLPPNAPHVTILIPAKDEGEGIRKCLDAVLAQDYPHFDVITIDDRSSDNTGSILDEIDANDARVTSMHIPPGGLPEGWLGKCNALTVGTQNAKGEWFFFVDSDVTLDPNALSAAMSMMLARNYDALSILTRLECHSFLERLMLPVLATAWAVMHVISWTNEDTRTDNAAANGQFFLIRRSAYESVGGHESVKDQITEDVELMRRLKASHHTVRLFMGAHLAATRMHSNLRQMFNGWARIYSGTARRRPWRIMGAMLFILTSILSLYPALGWGIYLAATGSSFLWLAAAVAHFVLMSLYLTIAYRWSGVAIRYGLLVPISSSIMLAILAYSLRKCQTGRITWRDTDYAAPHQPESL
jgi:cellulose synthase/poly-beta-1,6-N-acetylglucosamine synthase-like glycosyltransferase